MNEKYEQLIAEYLEGSLDEQARLRVEELIASGDIDLIEFRAMQQLHDELDTLSVPEPSPDMSKNFYAMLEAEKAASSGFSFDLVAKLREAISMLTLPRLAYAFVLLIVGAFVGNQFGTNNDQLEALSAEMQNMREMMMITMLEGPSTTDRLRAVNISAELPAADEQAIRALLFTLNNDESINVRVQTIQALSRWGDNEVVREGLVNSIIEQESEIVIVALADAMVELGVQNSVDKFEKLLQDREMDFNVQQKLQTSIAALL